MLTLAWDFWLNMLSVVSCYHILLHFAQNPVPLMSDYSCKNESLLIYRVLLASARAVLVSAIAQLQNMAASVWFCDGVFFYNYK